MNGGVEKISNDMDIAVEIQLKISPDQDFPWETLWQKMSQKAGEVDIVVIALQFDESDKNTAWIGYHKKTLKEKLGMKELASKIADTAALLVFVKNGSDLIRGVEQEYNCTGRKIAVHISLAKSIRGEKYFPTSEAAKGRNMQLHWLSVNLDGETHRNDCIKQLTDNAKQHPYNEENSSIEILGYYPKEGNNIRRGLRALPVVRPFRSGRHLAALELRSLRRRLLGATETKPVCMDEKAVERHTATLIAENRTNNELSTWMRSEKRLMEGTNVENFPPATFSFPGGVMRKRKDSKSIERCFYDQQMIDMPSRVWVIPPTNEQVYTVVTKFQEAIPMDQHQSSRHGLPIVTINAYNIFEYHTGNSTDETLLIRGNDYRGDDRAVWQDKTGGTWHMDGIAYVRGKPVCDYGLDNETYRNNFAIVVCQKYNAQYYKIQLDHTTSHKDFGLSNVQCTGDETDLTQCSSRPASDYPDTCNPSTGRAVKVTCGWVVEAEYDFDHPTLDKDFLEMPSSSGTPHGGARQTATGTASTHGHIDLPVIDVQKVLVNLNSWVNNFLRPILVQPQQREEQ